MSRRIALVILVITVSILGVNCGPEPEQTPQIIEQGNFQGKPFTTELPVPNCDSDKELQTAQRIDQKYTHKVEIERAPNSKADLKKLPEVVRKHYLCPGGVDDAECTPPLAEVASYTVNANVPPGSIFTYQVEWTETWREGDIEIGEIDDDPEATYKFLEDLTGGVVGVETAKCP